MADALESNYSNEVNVQAEAPVPDTLAPGIPANLAAQIAQGKVTLSWDPVTKNHDNSDITDLGGYNILRKLHDEDEFTQIGQVDATHTSYEDTDIVDGATYIYAVNAYDTAETPNVGLNSEELTVKTIPGIPQNLAGSSADGKVNLTWDSVLNTESPHTNENLAGYNVYRSTTTGEGYTKIGSTDKNTTTYEDTDVEAGTTYYYVVTSYDNSGAAA